MKHKIDFFLHLPEHVQLQVLMMLSIKDIIHFSKVSKQANIISKHPQIWENLIEKTFGENALQDYQNESHSGITPKEFYRITHLLLQNHIESIKAVITLPLYTDLAQLTTEFKNEYLSLRTWLQIPLVEKYDTLIECEVTYSKVIRKIKDKMTAKKDNIFIEPFIGRSHKEISSYLYSSPAKYAYVSSPWFKFIATLGISLDIRQGTKNSTALMYAAYRGDIRCAKALIDAGASLNLQSINGNTALHYACQEGKIEVVKILIATGASLNVQNIQGFTALDYAILGSDIYKYNPIKYQPETKAKIIELLIAAGASIDYLSYGDRDDLMYLAAQNGLLMTFKLLLADSELLIKRTIPLRNHLRMYHLTRLLDIAVKNHKFTIIQALFEAMGSFRAIDIEVIRSVLFISTALGVYTIVSNLIPDLIALDMIDTDGRTAMLIAAEKGEFFIVLKLIKAGALTKYFTIDHLANYISNRSVLHHRTCFYKTTVLNLLFKAHLEGFYKEACKAKAERLPDLLSKYNEVELIITQEKMLDFILELTKIHIEIKNTIDMRTNYTILNNAILTKPNGAPAHALSALMHEGEGWFAKSAAVQKINAAVFSMEPDYGTSTSHPYRIAFSAEPAAMRKAEEIRKVTATYQL